MGSAQELIRGRRAIEGDGDDLEDRRLIASVTRRRIESDGHWWSDTQMSTNHAGRCTP
jgi:hypothetical protein